MSTNVTRVDGRKADQLRPITFEANVAPNATGSVLVSFGATRVICAATIEPKVPLWMKQQKVPGGWLTAEYSMLPYSTLDRKQREVVKGKQEGRTASITGAYLAARLAIQKLLDANRLRENPLTDSVAAVSAGVFQGQDLLDLNYIEDKDAEVDANVVMTGRGQFVELQSSGEEATFSREQLLSLTDLAQKGLKEIASLQTAFLTQQLLKR